MQWTPIVDAAGALYTEVAVPGSYDTYDLTKYVNRTPVWTRRIVAGGGPNLVLGPNNRLYQVEDSVHLRAYDTENGDRVVDANLGAWASPGTLAAYAQGLIVYGGSMRWLSLSGQVQAEVSLPEQTIGNLSVYGRGRYINSRGDVFLETYDHAQGCQPNGVIHKLTASGEMWHAVLPGCPQPLADPDQRVAVLLDGGVVIQTLDQGTVRLSAYNEDGSLRWTRDAREPDPNDYGGDWTTSSITPYTMLADEGGPLAVTFQAWVYSPSLRAYRSDVYVSLLDAQSGTATATHSLPIRPLSAEDDRRPYLATIGRGRLFMSTILPSSGTSQVLHAFSIPSLQGLYPDAAIRDAGLPNPDPSLRIDVDQSLSNGLIAGQSTGQICPPAGSSNLIVHNSRKVWMAVAFDSSPAVSLARADVWSNLGVIPPEGQDVLAACFTQANQFVSALGDLTAKDDVPHHAAAIMNILDLGLGALGGPLHHWLVDAPEHASQAIALLGTMPNLQAAARSAGRLVDDLSSRNVLAAVGEFFSVANYIRNFVNSRDEVQRFGEFLIQAGLTIPYVSDIVSVVQQQISIQQQLLDLAQHPLSNPFALAGKLLKLHSDNIALQLKLASYAGEFSIRLASTIWRELQIIVPTIANPARAGSIQFVSHQT